MNIPVTKILALLLVLMLIPAVIAPSHPVFIDPETGETLDIILGDPGTTPNSLWYGFERWWENIQVVYANTPEEEAELLQDLMQERYAEFHAMIEEGHYDMAQYTLRQMEAVEYQLVGAVEQVEVTPAGVNFIHDIEENAFIQEQWREMLEQNMENLVATGEMSLEQVNDLATEMEESIDAVHVAVEREEEEISDILAQEQGITHLDAQLQIETQEQQSGLTQQQQEEVQEELIKAEQELNQLQSDVAAAIGAGEEVPLAAMELIAEAQAHLDSCRKAYLDELYGESFGQFISAGHLIDTAQGFLKDEVSSEELAQVVDASREQSIENNQEYLDEYEKNLDRWIEEYPQYADTFDNWAVQSRNELALYLEMGEEPFMQLQEQLRQEGKTDEEIFTVVTDRYRDEYERAFGVPYVPPVIESVDDGSVIFHYDEKGNVINPSDDNDGFKKESTPFDSASTKGGFVEGYMYTDPVSGYTYEFTSNGYKYTTPLGITYEQTFPKNFNIPVSYEQGNEEHSYVKQTSEGIVTYTYYATGYDVALPDGTVETYSYPPGSYDVAGGGLFNYHPTGFEYRHDEEAVWYDYSPVYDTFVREDDGSTYRPHDGVYFHEDIDYSYEEQRYEFADPQGVMWTYNPESHAWSSSDGQIYTPDAAVIAPIGHEGEGNYETELGESWTWDETTNMWQNNAGDMFHPESNTWQPGEGTAAVNEQYTFDPATGQYLDAETGEAASNVVWSGVTWVYDSTANTWTSNTGESYNGGQYQVPSARHLEPGLAPYDAHKVYDFDPALGKFIDPETNQVADIAWSGVTWTRDAETSEWSSNTGETRTEDWTGDYNHEESSGNWQSEPELSWTYEPNAGTWASPGWSYDSSNGAWTSPEGGTFHDPDGNPTGWQDENGGWHGWDGSSGTMPAGGVSYIGDTTGSYDGGSYSGGDSSGSTSSGGESGYSDSRGDRSGTGGTVAQRPPQHQEISPTTKWIYKYLGIKY